MKIASRFLLTVTAGALLVTSTGCSLIAVRPPPTVESIRAAPDRAQPQCTLTTIAPLFDGIGGFGLVVAGIGVGGVGLSRSDLSDKGRAEATAGLVTLISGGLLWGAVSYLGYSRVWGCEDALAEWNKTQQHRREQLLIDSLKQVRDGSN